MKFSRLLLPAFALCAPGFAAQATGAAVQSKHGLHTVSYNTLQGTVRVHLPDDLAPGDTISGTVSLEPAGRTDAERAANTATLRGTVIDVAGRPVGTATPLFTLAVPAAASETIPVVFGAGRARATASVPALTPSAAALPAPAKFAWPPVLTTGAPATIAGPFDGDATNTQVSLGGEPATVLAESPRRATVQVQPEAPPGPSQLAVSDGPRLAHGAVRVVQVQLTAPKLDLQRAETTPVSVAVTGLGGLRHPVPFQLRTGGAVMAEGGNLQRFDIKPADPGVAAGGVFRTARTLTGVRAGTFDVTGEVVWANPAPHWLAGKLVHIEGAPGGNPGNWRVPVKLAGVTWIDIVYLADEKRPDLKFCNWIEVGAAKREDGRDYITGWKRTTDPAQTPPKKKDPAPAGTALLTPPVTPPGPAAGGGGAPATDEPPPCEDGTEKELSAVKDKFTLLDGKQELFLQVYTDKDGAAQAAGDFAAYLDAIAKAGRAGKPLLPKGDGPGGAVVGALLRYLGQGSATIEAVLAGKLRLAGATKFTATMNAGLREIDATCATVAICVRGVWVTEKRYTEAETKRRETFTWTANQGDDAWEKISNSSGRIDPKKAADWANEQFTRKAQELSDEADRRDKFKAACK